MKLRDTTLKIVTLLIVAIMLVITGVIGLSFIVFIFPEGLVSVYYQIIYVVTLIMCFFGAGLSLFTTLRGRWILRIFALYFMLIVFVGLVLVLV